MDYQQRAMQLKATGDDRVRRRFVPAEPCALLAGVDAQQRPSATIVERRASGTDRIIDLGDVLAGFLPKTGRVVRLPS
jgi:hypothetical protein